MQKAARLVNNDRSRLLRYFCHIQHRQYLADPSPALGERDRQIITLIGGIDLPHKNLKLTSSIGMRMHGDPADRRENLSDKDAIFPEALRVVLQDGQDFRKIS